MGEWEGILLTVGACLAAIITAALGMWGTRYETTTPDADGNKRLNSKGRIAFCFILAGLVTNLVCMWVSSRLETARNDKHIADERLRALRIAASSQPLQSIEIEWRFSGMKKDGIAKLAQLNEKAHETLDKVDSWLSKNERDLTYEEQRELSDHVWAALVAYPWWATLASGEWAEEPDVLIRLALNPSQAVVLPFGALHFRERTTALLSSVDDYEKGEGTTDSWLSDETEPLWIKWRLHAGAGIAGYEDVVPILRESALPPDVARERTRPTAVTTSVALDKDDLVICMELGAYDFQQAVDKVDANLAVLSLLPNELDVTVLTSFDDEAGPWGFGNLSGPLPRGKSFSPSRSTETNANSYDDSDLWRAFENCTLSVVVNGIVDLRSDYDMLFFERGEITEPSYDTQYVCDYALLKFRKRD